MQNEKERIIIIFLDEEIFHSVPLNYIMFKKKTNSGSNFESFRNNKGPYFVVCAG